MPPVAKTATPAAAARDRAPDTVVAPDGQLPATATGMSLDPSFSSAIRTRSQSTSSTPTRTSPASTTVSAGTAPPARTAATQASRHSRFTGGGRPNSLKIVDSSATTARRWPTRSATSSWIRIIDVS